MILKVFMLSLIAIALGGVINTDKRIEERGHVNSVRPPTVAASAGLEGRTYVCEFRKPAGDCTDLLFSYCSGSFTYRTVPSYEGCVADTTRRSSDLVHRPSGGEVRVRSTPRVIDIGGFVDVQREEYACLDGKRRVLDCDDD